MGMSPQSPSNVPPPQHDPSFPPPPPSSRYPRAPLPATFQILLSLFQLQSIPLEEGSLIASEYIIWSCNVTLRNDKLTLL